MKFLVRFFSILTVLFGATTALPTPESTAFEYFEESPSSDKSAFLKIVADSFTKLKTDAQLLSPEDIKALKSRLSYMQNLARHFDTTAKHHAQVLLNWLTSNPKFPHITPRAPATLSATSSTTASTTTLPSSVKKDVQVSTHKNAAAKPRKPGPHAQKKSGQNPYQQKVVWDNKDGNSSATIKSEVRAALTRLKKFNTNEARRALTLWQKFGSFLQHQQHQEARAVFVGMIDLERVELQRLQGREVFSNEHENPQIAKLYQIRQSIQVLHQEMKRLLGLKQQQKKPRPHKPSHSTKSNLQSPRIVMPPSPRKSPQKPVASDRPVPTLPLAAIPPKPILKDPSHRKGQSGASRGTQATRFTSDTKMTTARFTYPRYWTDYLNGSETISYSARRFKRDASGRWNSNAFVPLRSIIGTPGTHFEGGLSFADAEACHSWIQWAFPTMRASGHNSFAKTSDPSVLSALQENPALYQALFDAFRYYLAFMGLTIQVDRDGMFSNVSRIQFGQAHDYPVRMENILHTQHNFSRITRIIASLREHGLSNCSTAFCSYLTNTLPTLDRTFGKASTGSIGYWKGAAKMHRTLKSS